jgi:hypothetical protein
MTARPVSGARTAALLASGKMRHSEVVRGAGSAKSPLPGPVASDPVRLSDMNPIQREIVLALIAATKGRN